ncbi:MAG: hypothetical protein AABW73_04045 [Nanoarchaeota archaeon]
MVEQQGFVSQDEFSPIAKLRDLEEKHKLLKERILLIGENLVDFRSEISHGVSSMKSVLDAVRDDVDKLTGSVRRISEDVESRARKADLEILQRQARMFEPLKLTTVDDVKRIIQESKL